MASHLSDVLPHVFNHHFISSDWLQSEQTPVVDVRLAESDLFLTELRRREFNGAVRRGEKSPTNKTSPAFGAVVTFSWLNFSRSLSHAKEESRRRCSDRRSEPALVEAWTCAGMLMPC